MVEKELKINKNIKKIRLREIAVNNLFGIDIEKQALKVTCFSIYIAMLDYIDPASILTSFRFPDLIGNNLFEADFFDTNHAYNNAITSENINFILGNPPWKSDKSFNHQEWLKNNNITIARFEIAQSFLLRSKAFMNVETIASLIVTSTIFYNVAEPAKAFKRNFLTTFCIDHFFDLSPVRRLIFEEKDNPCAVVMYHLSQEDKHLTNTIYHTSVKSNIFLKYFKTLVIEKFDQKRILQKYFIENEWMFKVALYGNSLDFAFIKRIDKNKGKIIDSIDNLTIFKGAGIERGKQGKPYPSLEGLPIIENREVKRYYSKPNLQHTLKKDDVYLSRGRKIEIFDGYKILFKEQNEEESVPLISFIEFTCVFRKGISAVTSKTHVNKLKSIYSCVISDLYTYFLFIRSCSWGVSTRPQTRFDEEYLAFPLIADDNAMIDLASLATDFLSSFKEFYEKEFPLGYPIVNKEILHEINLKIEQLYSLKSYERDLIDFVLKVSRYQFQESKQSLIIRKIHREENTLAKYVDVFLTELEKLYPAEYLKADIYILDYFIAVNFVFQNEKPLAFVNFVSDVTSEEAIFKILSNKLSIAKKAQNLYIQKDIKGFEENSFYIIKPNEYKCWHRAMAWYDLAEIKAAIEAAEIDHLTESWNAS